MIITHCLHPAAVSLFSMLLPRQRPRYGEAAVLGLVSGFQGGCFIPVGADRGPSCCCSGGGGRGHPGCRLCWLGTLWHARTFVSWLPPPPPSVTPAWVPVDVWLGGADAPLCVPFPEATYGGPLRLFQPVSVKQNGHGLSHRPLAQLQSRVRLVISYLPGHLNLYSDSASRGMSLPAPCEASSKV